MTPATARAMYARQIGAKGETVKLRREGEDDVEVRAFVKDNYPTVDVNDVAQNSRRVAIVLAEDVEAGDFETPFLERQDRVLWGNGAAEGDVVQRVATRRVAGVVIAYELELEGS